MVKAELRYRTNAPVDSWKREFTHLSFEGEESVAKVLDEIKRLLTFERKEEIEPKIKALKKHAEDLTKRLREAERKSDVLKEERFWVFKKEIRAQVYNLHVQCDEMYNEGERLNVEYLRLKEQENYSPRELLDIFVKLLKGLGFECKSGGKDDSRRHVYAYESTCSDKELKQRATKLIEDFKKRKTQGPTNAEELEEARER